MSRRLYPIAWVLCGAVLLTFVLLVFRAPAWDPLLLFFSGLAVVASLGLVMMREAPHTVQAEPAAAAPVDFPLQLAPTPDYSAAPHPVPAPDPLANAPWLSLAEECVTLLDELEEHKATFDPARQALVEYVIDRLQELLERAGIETITGDTLFDRSRHQPEPASASVAPETTIAETLSPGFAVGRRVLRRARVRLTGSVSH